MKKEDLYELYLKGGDIEFECDGKWYSITWFIENGEKYVSFCEFYNEPTDVQTFDELINIKRYGKTVLEMWESLDEETGKYIIC